MVMPMAIARKFLASAARGRFVRDRRGVAAVEFAAILPLLLLLAFGCIEITDGLAIKRKLTHATSSVGDLYAQSKVVTDADKTNFLNVTSAIMKPYPEGPLKIVVAGVTLDANANPTVIWSDAKGTNPLQVGSVYPLPENLKVPNTFLVVSETTYTYTPRIAYLFSGDVPMKDRFYFKPRLTAKVCRPPQTPVNCI
jgi:Flp pilus assembly protein TadG